MHFYGFICPVQLIPYWVSAQVHVRCCKNIFFRSPALPLLPGVPPQTTKLYIVRHRGLLSWSTWLCRNNGWNCSSMRANGSCRSEPITPGRFVQETSERGEAGSLLEAPHPQCHVYVTTSYHVVGKHWDWAEERWYMSHNHGKCWCKQTKPARPRSFREHKHLDFIQCLGRITKTPPVTTSITIIRPLFRVEGCSRDLQWTIILPDFCPIVAATPAWTRWSANEHESLCRGRRRLCSPGLTTNSC